MEVWSELARLGAAVAAFGPPVLTRANDEVNQVDMPTAGADGPPTANLVLEIQPAAGEVLGDIDQYGDPGYVPQVDRPTADVPTPSSLVPLPDTKRTGKGGRAALHPLGKDLPRPRGWHGGGQRYE